MHWHLLCHHFISNIPSKSADANVSVCVQNTIPSGPGMREICLKQVLLLCPLGTLLFYCHPSMANGLSAVALGIARKDQTHRWKCDKIRFLCCVESAGVSPPKPGTGVVQWCFCRAKSTREEPVWSPCGKEAAWKRTGFFTGQKYHPLPRFAFYMPAFGRTTKAT